MNRVWHIDQVSRLSTGGVCCRVRGELSAKTRWGFQFIYREALSIHWNNDLSRFEDRYKFAKNDLEESCWRMLSTLREGLNLELQLGTEIDWTDIASGERDVIIKVFRESAAGRST